MLQAYVEAGMENTAVFEFFVRHLPPQRKFFMAAGLEQVVDFLEGLSFCALGIGMDQRERTVQPILCRLFREIAIYRRSSGDARGNGVLPQ